MTILTSSMQHKRFKLHISLNHAIIPEGVVFEGVVYLKAVEVSWLHVTHTV